MSKELEALERIKDDLEYITRLDYVSPIVRGEVRDELYKIYHRELPDLDLIETALKGNHKLKKEKQSLSHLYGKNELILKIIKEKRVDVDYLLFCLKDFDKPLSHYNRLNEPLTETEFNLLKGVLK